MIDTCFGVKTILKQVALFVELLVNVGGLQEVTFDEGWLMKNHRWIDRSTFSHQFPPCLTVGSSHSPSVTRRYDGLLNGPVGRLSLLVLLLFFSPRRGTGITLNIFTLAEVTKMVILTRIAKLSNTILRFVIPILVLFDDLLDALSLDAGD